MPIIFSIIGFADDGKSCCFVLCEGGDLSDALSHLPAFFAEHSNADSVEVMSGGQVVAKRTRAELLA